MKAYYSDSFILPLPVGHRFPLPKYALLRQRILAARLLPAEDISPAPPASEDQLRLVHTPDWVTRVAAGSLTEKEIRRIGFPWSPEMVERSRRSVGGTIAACRSALQDGMAANLAGGTHHAYADHGEGYCVFNDVAVAARVMQAEGRVRRVVVLDCDVHQGNGTASMFNGDDSIFTFSIHGEKNFPFHKEKSTLDIGLPDGTGDEAYLEALLAGVRQSLERARANLAVYLAGSDPYMDDRLGRLSLSKDGLAERDRLVFAACHNSGLPVAITMAGGYARQIDDSVDIHFQTIKIAVELVKREVKKV